MGRPAKHTETSLALAGEAYFLECKRLEKMPTKAGLMLVLDISRETYSEYKGKYPDTIRVLNVKIEDAWLQKLTGAGATGPIFYLKNAFKEDYRDRTETDITTKGEAMTAPSNIEEIAARVAQELKEQKT